jgi:3-hydroxyacyl-CoA dehydrogenase
MGQGIAISLIKAGFITTLIERDEQTLAQRIADIWQTMADDVRKGRVTKGTIANAGQLLRASTDFEALRNVDFVIEAVFENMALKQDVFRILDRVCPPHAILCSNTSTLDIETLARATKRPKNVVGMHFFVPSHLNAALEVIYCNETTCREAVGTVVAMGQLLEKIPVVMRNGPGFVGNRMFRSYLTETLLLLEDGYTPNEVDVAFRNFGFALGPFQSLDLIGLDTGLRIAEENKWQLSKIMELLVEHGRLGRKTGKGFYAYKDNHRHQDEEVERLLAKVRNNHRRPSLTQEEMVRRCLYPLVNEGFDVLSDKIVERPESVDAMWILGYGWPPSVGGPMYWAQKEGLHKVLDYITKQKQQNPSYRWRPSPLLERLVKKGAGDLPVEQWTQLISKL